MLTNASEFDLPQIVKSYSFIAKEDYHKRHLYPISWNPFFISGHSRPKSYVKLGGRFPFVKRKNLSLTSWQFTFTGLDMLRNSGQNISNLWSDGGKKRQSFNLKKCVKCSDIWSRNLAAGKMGKFYTFSWKMTFCFDKPVSFLESGTAEHSRVSNLGSRKFEKDVKIRRLSGNATGGCVAR